MRERTMAARLLTPWAVLVVVWATAAISRAEEPQAAPVASAKLLTVELASGRQFTGFVDVTTNQERLVLRFARDGATLKRPIEWSRVVRAAVDGTAIEPERVRETALGMKSEGATGRSREPEPSDQEPGTGSQLPETGTIEPRVSSVSFDARLAN